MSDIHANRQIGYFFKYDGRAHTFIKSFFAGSDFKSAPKITEKSVAYDVLKASNYSDAKDNGYTDKDVHPEFSDFIYNVGLFHKSLDGSTYVDITAETILDYITDRSNETAIDKIIENSSLSMSEQGIIRTTITTILDTFNISSKTDVDINIIVISINNLIKQYSSPIYYTLANREQQIIWQNIYAHWAQNTTTIKNFYREFVSVAFKKNGNWLRLDECDYHTVLLNENFRLNINKTSIGVPIFALIIPKLPVASFERVLITENGSIHRIDASPDALKHIYLNAYCNGGDKIPKLHENSGFNIQVDELVRQRLNRRITTNE